MIAAAQASSHNYALAEVRLWDRLIGAVVEDRNGQITFEYDTAFRRSGLEISPLHLPLSQTGPIQFPALRRLEAFEGLPGVLADALPDRFGNAIIQSYFSRRGEPERALSPVQKLLYIGNRAMGALEFRPALHLRERRAEQESLEIRSLVEQARRLIEGDTDQAVREIMRVGGSAGGARPKAVILWNREARRVRSAFAKPAAGDQHWLIKFDGVGELDQPDPAPQPYNRIEYVYSRMARHCGIQMPETFLLEERRLGHFMARRFDRVDGRRLHMHTLGGMTHTDFNHPGLFSYEGFFRAMQQLRLDFPDRLEGFRRALFNLMTVNQDDHVKNLSFLMDPHGRWRLAPAYDLTYAAGANFTRRHQMSFNGKQDGFDWRDVQQVADNYGFKRHAPAIADAIRDSLNRWPDWAAAAGVPQDRIGFIAARFRWLKP